MSEEEYRKNMRKYLSAFIIIAVLFFVSAISQAQVYQKTTPSDQFTIITYNVAGLPFGLSSGNPEEYIVQISPKLNAFDIVQVQEDFGYHTKLISRAGHPYKSRKDVPLVNGALGDGLNTLSYCPFYNFQRQKWSACNGYLDGASDCMTHKGFTYASFEIAPGVFIDMYNLHQDAGGGAADIAARAVNVDQLINFVLNHSEGRAIIMVGDFNMRSSDADDAPLLYKLMNACGLSDSRLAEGMNGQESIDKILYRGGDDVSLKVLDYAIDDNGPRFFYDPNGNRLSDHSPTYARFQWSEIADGPVTLYEHVAYGGYGVTLDEGEYTLASLQAKGIRNDDISSIRVASGYRITVFEQDQFGGALLTFIADARSLINNGWNDRISSIVVQKVSSHGLKAKANGKYVCAQSAGSLPLIANRNTIGQWETFELIKLGNSRVALKSMANGKYVSASSGSALPLIANRPSIGPAETFIMVSAGSGSVGLKAGVNGKYVSAESRGRLPLVANRNSLGSWETFELIPL